MGLIPGLRRSPGGGHGNPLQYPCLENCMDRGAWHVTVHRVMKSRTPLKWLCMCELPTTYRNVSRDSRWCYIDSIIDWKVGPEGLWGLLEYCGSWIGSKCWSENRIKFFRVSLISGLEASERSPNPTFPPSTLPTVETRYIWPIYFGQSLPLACGRLSPIYREHLEEGRVGGVMQTLF